MDIYLYENVLSVFNHVTIGRKVVQMKVETKNAQWKKIETKPRLTAISSSHRGMLWENRGVIFKPQLIAVIFNAFIENRGIANNHRGVIFSG